MIDKIKGPRCSSVLFGVLIAVGLAFCEPDIALAQVTGSGTINKIPKWTTTTTNLSDSVIFDNGNVGIGLTDPVSRLEVAGDIRGRAANPALYLYNTSGVVDFRQFYFWNTGGLIVGRWVNDANAAVVAESITFKNNGNIGFGSTSPNYKLDILGGNASQLHITNPTAGLDSGLYFLTAGSDNVYMSGGAAYNGGSWIAKSTSAELLSESGGAFIFYGNTGLTAGNTFTPTERARIDAVGSLGLGTAAPGAKLHLSGPSASFGSGLKMTSTDSGGKTFAFYPLGNTLVIRDDTAGVARVTIDTNGKVGIGTATPSNALDVVGNINATGNITATGNIAAKYQDIAEWVPARNSISVATVVVLDSEKSNHVLASSQAYDTRVAGVISERPGVILGEAGAGKVLVATTGRVRVKVDATAAPIRVGDLLVTSNKQGIAMRSLPLDLGGTPIHRPGTLIGKALEPLDKGLGEILVLLSLQ